MSQSHNKPLLSDVLAEDSDSGFREALLDHTLQSVRRRRRLRKARQVVHASLIVAGLVLAGIHFLVPKPRATKRLEISYTLIATQPLAANAVLSTTGNHSIALISSSRTRGMEIVATSENTGLVRQLDDEQLLTLLPSPALLVRRGPHLAELVFADANAQHALFPN
jgi:hypothetical protein